jgi:carboxymethylenebutenolidase
MTVNDLSDMQRYLVEEEAEKWREGFISRREFVRRVTLMVGGAAAAGGVLLSLGCDTSAPEATPTALLPTAVPPATVSAGEAGASIYHVAENDPAVRAEMVDIPPADPSYKLAGYLATPTDTEQDVLKWGGVLVIHENRGLTEHIKDVVRRVAKAGYVGLGVDLVSREGGSAAHPDESERTAILSRLSTDQLLADLSKGLDYLKSRDDVEPSKLAALGFCFGGGMTWRIATKRPDLKAAVPFYGPNPPLEDVPNIKAAVLGIYGGNDTRITGQAPDLEEALKKAGVTYEMKIFEGADHAFHNDTGARYKPDAAKEAWEQTLAWLGTHMS